MLGRQALMRPKAGSSEDQIPIPTKFPGESLVRLATRMEKKQF